MKYLLKCHLGISTNYNYTIYNEKDEIVYKATEDGNLGGIDRLLSHIIQVGHYIYVKDLNDNELFTIKKQFAFFKGKYNILFSDNISMTVREGSLFKKPKIIVKMIDKTYMIIGDIRGCEFFLKQDTLIIAIIKVKRGTIQRQYEITVFENEFKKVSIAAAFIVDNIYHV